MALLNQALPGLGNLGCPWWVTVCCGWGPAWARVLVRCTHLHPSLHSLKSSLQKTLLVGETVDLSGIPLSARDVQHISRYLDSRGVKLVVLDLSFTELSDELLHLLLPSLWALPRLTQLLLNGNRLTRAAARELTESIKDTAKFPVLAWVDLGNNVDVSSLPQPLLVGLRRRLSQHTSLPTIYEGLDLEPGSGMAETTAAVSSWGSAATEAGPEPQGCCAR